MRSIGPTRRGCIRGLLTLWSRLASAASGWRSCSNKPDDFTGQVVAHYFQPSPFHVVRGQRPGVPLKPDPSAALEITRQLNVPAAEWLYLGDTNTDMHTAVAAGMWPVGALWGFRDRDELLKSGAQALVARPEQVLTLLDERGLPRKPSGLA